MLVRAHPSACLLVVGQLWYVLFFVPPFRAFFAFAAHLYACHMCGPLSTVFRRSRQPAGKPTRVSEPNRRIVHVIRGTTRDCL
jgi:hypothetical protein